MSFILLPSLIIVDVTAVGVIIRVGLMLRFYEAWCSAPTHHVGHCEHCVSVFPFVRQKCGLYLDICKIVFTPEIFVTHESLP